MDFSTLAVIESDPKLSPYYEDVRDFLTYLNRTEGTRFRLRGLSPDVSEVETEIEYVHRWTATYRRGWIAKLYQLDEWYKREQPPVTMLTLTTYQDGDYSRWKGRYLTIPESFETLKGGWKNLSMVLRKPDSLGKFDYLSIMEPHKTGYPHLHVPIFAEVSDPLQEKIGNLWEGYGAGSAEHGVNFSFRESRTDISSIRNYLLKYLSKGLTGTGSRFGDESLTPGQWVFQALVWRHHWRIFGSSRNLSQVMTWDRTSEPVQWLSTDLIDQNGDVHPLWRQEGSEALLDGLFSMWEPAP